MSPNLNFLVAKRRTYVRKKPGETLNDDFVLLAFKHDRGCVGVLGMRVLEILILLKGNMKKEQYQF